MGWFRYGLRGQLSLNLGVVMLISSMLLSFLAMYVEQVREMRGRRRLLQSFGEQIEVVWRHGAMGEGASLDRLQRLRGWLGEMSGFPVASGLATGERGEVLWQMGRLKSHEKEKILAHLRGLERSAWQLVREKGVEGEIWERWLVLDLGGGKRAKLWLRWRLSVDIREFFAYQALLLLYLGSFCLLLLLLLLLFLSRRLVKPLERLGRAMEQLAQRGQGDGLEAEVIRGDEIGDLARSFVEMEAILRRHREQREEQIKALEEAHQALQRAQEELIQREKLSTIGQMAAGVAHEVGNPLSAIMGYSELLQETEAWGEMEADLAARIYRETKRIDRIIRELLSYARPVQATERSGNPLRAIEEMLALLPLQPRFREMKVTTQLPAHLPTVSMAEASLIQVLLNLLLNAADACGGQGWVEIRAVHDEERGEVSLWMEDSGAGIPEAIRERLFEPFFTTKAPGKGVGLGLAICQRLVVEAGGSLSVTQGRHPEKGACFLLRLKEEIIS